MLLYNSSVIIFTEYDINFIKLMKMGNISGFCLAKCKECSCVLYWYVNSMPFVDSQFIGTCSNCVQEKDHDCVNEQYDPIKILGRKVFSRSKVTSPQDSRDLSR